VLDHSPTSVEAGGDPTSLPGKKTAIIIIIIIIIIIVNIIQQNPTSSNIIQYPNKINKTSVAGLLVLSFASQRFSELEGCIEKLASWWGCLNDTSWRFRPQHMATAKDVQWKSTSAGETEMQEHQVSYRSSIPAGECLNPESRHFSQLA